MNETLRFIEDELLKKGYTFEDKGTGFSVYKNNIVIDFRATKLLNQELRDDLIALKNKDIEYYYSLTEKKAFVDSCLKPIYAHKKQQDAEMKVQAKIGESAALIRQALGKNYTDIKFKPSEEYVLLIDKDDPQRGKRVFDLQTNKLLSVSYNTYFEWYKSVYHPGKKTVVPIFMDNLIVSCIYEPKIVKCPITSSGCEDWYNLNLYVSPPWMTEEYRNKVPHEIPSPIYDFMWKLFKENGPTIELILDWIANSLFDETLGQLTLASETQGNGKSTFLKIIAGLHCPDRVLSNGSWIEEKFNGSLFNKTLNFIDEFSIKDKKQHSRWKNQVSNKGIDAREMYKDAGRKISQPISYCAATNEPGGLHMRDIARRYMIPNIIDQKLANYIADDPEEAKEKINLLMNLGEAFTSKGTQYEKDLMASFGWFLYDRFMARETSFNLTDFEDFKPQAFWDCYYLNFEKSWQRVIIDWFETESEKGQRYSYAKIESLFALAEIEPKYIPSPKKVITWMKGFTWKRQPLIEKLSRPKDVYQTLFTISYDKRGLPYKYDPEHIEVEEEEDLL